MPLRLLFLIMILISAQAGETPSWYEAQRDLYFGIPVTVRFTPPDAALAERAWQVLEAIDSVYNDYKADSEIGRINAAPAGTCTVSDDLAEAFTLAGQARTLTGGACEITVGPLRRLWRQAEKDGALPTAERIAAVRQLVGPDVYTQHGTTLTKSADGVAFDFGGVCKGMAVERVVRLLRAAGRTAGFVQVGGETGCWGESPRGGPHRLGIPHPDDPDGRLWCIIRGGVDGFSGSTSGNYRKPTVVAGRTLYHIYDPRTGQPCDVHVLSVSIAFPGGGRNGLADALTKGGIVDGPERFLPMIAAQGGQAMILIRAADGGIHEHHTDGWPALVAEQTSQAVP
jgi:thiamine biosynthesis lipoprotein